MLYPNLAPINQLNMSKLPKFVAKIRTSELIQDILENGNKSHNPFPSNLFKVLSGWGESNPHHQLGRLRFYH